ncbi:diacylglycerol O-acyltransferase [Synchytrium microbalum]|uniref:O-acyltransferase n=1 Tax=Synchytrium microbalum TaxID=1806994 RepID=A0A507C1Y0_9FUNG|nr:diacylglycerol O-acyltransferase [Synchytrium microbalum]TPX33712.1 diacylglycerol O-acyltransferase [Synchytrium microbalum]
MATEAETDGMSDIVESPRIEAAPLPLPLNGQASNSPRRRRQSTKNTANSPPLPGTPQAHISPSSPRAHGMTYSHSLYIHTTVRASPLSKESPEQNYRGLLNLAMILLFVSNMRLVVENYFKYGLLIRLPSVEQQELMQEMPFLVLAILIQAGHVLIAYSLELAALYISSPKLKTAKRVVTKPNALLDLIIAILQHVNTLGGVTVACFIVWYKIFHPLAAFTVVVAATVTSLKLFSYTMVNRDLRISTVDKKYEDKDSRVAEPLDGLKQESALQEVPYPSNLVLEDILLFWVLPTLVYQTSYPRTTFRWDFCVKRLGEVIFCLVALYSIASQYAAPTLANSLLYLEKGDSVKLAERVMKLSVISVMMWLTMFFGFFHAWMNLLAEITRFGDRRFYLPWWNSSDIAQYWRLWNAPVYNWSKRHVYLPLVVNHKFSSAAATAIVFVVSAVLHEVIIGVPLHNINFWAFNGMMMQLPLIYLSRYLDHLRGKYFPSNKNLFDNLGNVLFWVSFTIVGQPTITLMYYAQYVSNRH